MAGSIGSAEGSIKIDTGQAIGAINDLSSSIGKLDAAAGAGRGMADFNQSTVGMAQGMQNVGRAAAGLGIGIAAPFVAATKSAIDFESQMAGVNAVMDLQGAQFQELNDLALQLGRDTNFSATEAAQGIEALGKAGVSYQDIMTGAADASTNLAAAAGSSVPHAAEIIAAALNAYSLSGTEATQVADMLAGASNASLASLDDLGVGFGQVAGVAAALGVPMDELITQLAIMTDMGLSGSDAATSIKTALNSLVAPIGAAAKEQGKLGISFRDSNGEFIGLHDTAGLLIDTYEALGYSQADILGSVKALAGQDGYRALLFAMQEVEDERNGGTKGWDEYSRAVNESGAAQKLAEERMDSTAGAIEKLMGSIETLSILAGSTLADAIRSPIEGATELINAISNIPAPILGAVAAFGALLGILVTLGGTVTVVAGYILEGVARLAAAGVTMGAVGGAAITLAANIALITAAILLLKAAIDNNLFGLGDAVRAVGDEVGKIADGIEDGSKAADQSGRDMSSLSDKIYALGAGLSKSTNPAIKKFGQYLITNVAEGLDQSIALFNKLSSKGINPVVAGLRAASKFADIFFGIGQGEEIVDFLSNAADKAELFSNALGTANANLNAAGYNKVASAIGAFGAALFEAFGPSAIVDTIIGIAEAVQVLDTVFWNALNGGLNPVSAALNALSAVAEKFGHVGLAETLLNASVAAEKFGNSFEKNFGQSQIDGMNGISGALSALKIAMLDAFGIDASGMIDPAIRAIEAFTSATERAAQNGLGPLDQALAGIDAALDTFLPPDVQARLDGLQRAIQDAATSVGNLLGAGLDRVGQLFSEIGTAISAGDFSGVAAAFGSLATDIQTELGKVAEQVKSIDIGELAVNVAGFVMGAIPDLWESVKGFFGVGGYAGEGGPRDAGASVGVIDLPSVKVNIAGFLQGVWTGIETLAGSLKTWIQENIASRISLESVKVNIANFAQGVWTGITEIAGNVKQWVTENLSGKINVDQVKVDISNFAQGTWTGISELAGTLKEWISSNLAGKVSIPNFNDWALTLGADGEITADAAGTAITEKLSNLRTDVGIITEDFSDWAINLVAGEGTVGQINLDAIDFPALIGAALVTALGESASKINEGITSDQGRENIASGSEGIGAALGEMIAGLLIGAIGNADDIVALPGNVTAAIGIAAVNLVQGLVGGFAEEINKAIDLAMNGALGGAGINEGGGRDHWGSQAPATISSEIDELAQQIGDAFAELPGKIDAAISDIGNPFDGLSDQIGIWAEEEAGKITGRLQPLKDAIDAAGRLKDTVGGLFAPSEPGVQSDEVATQEGFDVGKAWGNAYGTGFPAGAASGLNAAAPAAKTEIENGVIGMLDPVAEGDTVNAATEKGKYTGEAIGRAFNAALPAGAASGLNQAMPGTDAAFNQSMVDTLKGIDEIGSNIVPEDFPETPKAIADGIGGAIDKGVSLLRQLGTGGGSLDTGVGSAVDQGVATDIDGTPMTQTETAIGSKVGDAVQAGTENMGAQGADAARGGAAAAGNSIGSALDQVLATSIGGTTLQGFSQEIGVKIGEAITQGLSGASGAQGGRPGGSAGAADTSIGSSIANSLASSLQGADFTAVGTAIQTKISEALTAGLAEGGAAAPAGGAGAGIGASIASSLASSIAGADFTMIGTAISTKISQAVSTATAGGGAAGGRPGGAAGATGGGLGTAIAASIAGQIAGADFSAVGAAISTGIAGSMGTSLAPITEALSAVLSTVAAGAAGQAQGAMQAVGGAIAQGIASGIGPGAGGVISAAQAVVTSVVAGASSIAATANTVGTAFTTAVGSGIGAGTGTVTSAVQAMTQASIDGGVSTAAGATAVGEAFTTNAGAGIGTSTGTLISAVQAMVQAAIDAGIGAAAGASAIGAAISDGAASGVIVTALNGVVATMVRNGIAAGMEEAAAASPSKKMMELGGWMSEGAAIGVEKKSALFSKSMRNMVNEGMASFADIAESGDIVKSFSQAFDDGAGGFVSFGSELASIGDKIRAGAEDAANATQEMIDKLRKKIRDGRKGVKKDSDSLASASSGVSKGAGATTSFNIDTSGLKDGVKDILSSLSELGDASGKVRAYGEALSDMVGGSEIGPELLAIADDIDTSKTEAVESTNNLGKDISKVIKEIKKTMRAAAKEAGKAAGEGISEGMAESTPAAETAAATTSDAAVKSLNANLTRLPEMAQAMGAKTGEALGTGVQESIPAAEQAGADLVGALDAGIESMDNEIGNAGGDSVNIAIQAMDQTVANNAPFVEAAGTELGEALNIGLEAAKSPTAAFNVVKGLHDSITQSVRGAIPAVQTDGKALGDAMATGINQSNPSQAGKSLVDEATSGITTGTSLGSKTAENAGGDIGSSLEDGINASCAPVNKTATDLTDSCVPDGIDSGTGKAMDVADKAGSDISDALVKGMEIKKKDASKAFDTAGKGLGDAIKDGIGSKQNDAVQATGKVVTAAGNVNGSSKGKTVGDSIIDGMVQGVNQGSGELSSAVTRVVDQAIQAAKDTAKSKSPSKVFMAIGEDFMRGAAIGVDNAAYLLKDATERATDGSIDLFQGAGVAAATKQMDKALDDYTGRVATAIDEVGHVMERGIPLANLRNMPSLYDRREQQASVAVADHDDVPPIQIGDVILKEGDRGYDQARQLVDQMRSIAGQYRPS